MPPSLILQRIPTPTPTPLISGIVDTTFTGDITIGNVTSQLVDANGAPLKLSGGAAPQTLLVHPTDPPLAAHRVSAGALVVPAGGAPTTPLWTPGANGSYISGIVMSLDIQTATAPLRVIVSLQQAGMLFVGVVTDSRSLEWGGHGAGASSGSVINLTVINSNANASISLYYTVTGVDLQL